MIYHKTERAAAALQERQTLPTKLRSLLVMVDGVRSETELIESGKALGLGGDSLEQLRKLGLIEATGKVGASTGILGAISAASDAIDAPPPASDVERFSPLKDTLTRLASEHLGFKAFFFTLDIEKCATAYDLDRLSGELIKRVRAKSPTAADAAERSLVAAGYHQQ